MITMMGLIEVAAFLVGTAITAWGTYLYGNAVGFTAGSAWRKQWKEDGTRAMGFDQKVDIVCNACGLVGEFECASCHPVACETCGKTDCDWGATKSAVIKEWSP